MAAYFYTLATVCMGTAHAELPSSALQRAETAYAQLQLKPEALSYLREQAHLNDPYAAFYAGVASELGLGTPRNQSVALEYYRAAADKCREAAFNAGRILYSNRYPDDAVKYFVVAAGGDKADGIVRAMVLLGKIFETGQSQSGRNLVAAGRWYEAAARRKDSFAIAKVGEFSLLGIGRPQNIRDAKIYLERAADAWNANAQWLLGEVYSNARFSPINRTEAAKWYFIASRHSEEHKSRSAGYLAGLTDQELESAQRMADLWVAAHPFIAPPDYLAMIERLK